MRRHALVGLGALLIGTSFVSPASAAPEPIGPACGMVSFETAPGVQTAVLVGGPLVLGDNTNAAIVYSGSITCSIHYGVANGTHADPSVCANTGPVTGVVATFVPYVCQFAATDFIQEAFVCTQVNLVGGTTLYLDEPDRSLIPPGVAGWSLSPTASCARVVSLNLDDTLLQDLKQFTLDPILCPILVPFFPPQGDVGIFYDCPPYNTPPTHLFSQQVFLWLPPTIAV